MQRKAEDDGGVQYSQIIGQIGVQPCLDAAVCWHKGILSHSSNRRSELVITGGETTSQVILMLLTLSSLKKNSLVHLRD